MSTQENVICRPILFSGPMVRAILEGRKTQTRRIVTPQPDEAWSKSPIGVSESGYWVSNGCESDLKCPYGTVNDRLWVREAWARTIVGNQIDYLYRADHHTGIEKKNGDQKWKPSIHMPRTACRLMLEVTSVRVERVQEITADDCIAEGIESEVFDQTIGFRNYLEKDDFFVHWGDGKDIKDSARESYQSLWNKINDPDYSWASNPFVWVIEFRRLNQS